MKITTEKYENYLTNHLSQVSNKNSRIQWLTYNYQSYLPTNLSTKILEIGPGFGEFIDYLINKLGYKNTKAIDLSQEVVDVCNAIAPNSTSKVNDTSDFLGEYKNYFGMIFMLEVLEHIPKSETIDILSQIYNALEPGGILIVEVPNMGNPITGINFRYADFTHEAGFTDLSLTHVLQRAGFTQISIHPVNVPIVSLGRFFQFILQGVINQVLNSIKKVYMPGLKQISAHTIFAVAVKDS
jgi:2-polyprenyl-3-methyl-5-hydroxy-6-metoxy-1,4-benzoquinol methylase